MPLNRNTLISLVAFLVASSSFATTPIVEYKKKKYAPIGMDGYSFIVDDNGSLKSLKSFNLRLKKDRAKPINGAKVNIETCTVSLKTGQNKRLRLSGTLISNVDLSNCFAVLATESESKPLYVAREIDDLNANKPTSLAIGIDTDKVSVNEDYQLYLFSGSQHIALAKGSNHKGVILPYLISPRALFQVAPRFPKELMETYTEARVRIEFVIEADGSVSNVAVLESPDEAFSNEAIASIKRSLFSPRRIEGRKVPTKLQQWINFNLRKPAE